MTCLVNTSCGSWLLRRWSGSSCSMLNVWSRRRHGCTGNVYCRRIKHGFAPGEDMAADFLVYLVGLGTEFATGAEKGGLVVVVGSVFVVSLPLILS